MESKKRRIDHGSGTGELFLIGLFSYVFLASLLTSYLASSYLAEKNVNPIEFGGWTSVNTSTKDFTTTEDCTNSTYYYVRSGEWRCTANGLESQNPIYNEVVLSLTTGWYDEYINNSYVLYNPNHVNYDIIIRDAKYICSDMLTCGLWSSLNDWMYLKATDDGWVRDEGILSGQYDTDIDVSAYEWPVISTVYNTDEAWGEARYNGTLIFHDSHSETAWQPHIVYYGGIKAYGAGLVIRNTNSTSTTEVEGVAWDNPLSVFGLFAMVLVWNLPEVFGIPIWVNILFIKIPLIGLIWKMATFFRGIA